ncbi:MAG: thioesterase family protein [Planctomycetota bacterium]|nr:thioesterase family protein [Planctomycetota bacterium]
MPTFQTTRRVEFRDTDAAGIMHFSAFFTKFESVEHEFLRSVGLSVVAHQPEGILTWPRVSATCDYRGPARFEDVLDISLRIARLGEKSVTWHFTATTNGQPVADGRIVAVCVRLTAGGKMESTPIPAEVSDKLRPIVKTTPAS